MAQLFIIIYQLFKKHKLFFLFFLILITVSAVSFIYNIKIEEDINKAIPGKETKDKINISYFYKNKLHNINTKTIQILQSL